MQGKTEGGLPLTREVGIFVACFYWNHVPVERSVVMLASLDKTGPEAASIFEFSLDRVRFESATTGAFTLTKRAFCGSLKDSDVQNESISVGIGDAAEATVVLRGDVECPDICVNPIASRSFGRKETIKSSNQTQGLA